MDQVGGGPLGRNQNCVFAPAFRKLITHQMRSLYCIVCDISLRVWGGANVEVTFVAKEAILECIACQRAVFVEGDLGD